jgi:hypothetical protein
VDGTEEERGEEDEREHVQEDETVRSYVVDLVHLTQGHQRSYINTVAWHTPAAGPKTSPSVVRGVCPTFSKL